MCGCRNDHPGIECEGPGCFCHHAWPCERHEAHGPHDIPRFDAIDNVHWVYQCPGVGAHPNTMIGRNDVPARSSR